MTSVRVHALPRPDGKVLIFPVSDDVTFTPEEKKILAEARDHVQSGRFHHVCNAIYYTTHSSVVRLALENKIQGLLHHPEDPGRTFDEFLIEYEKMARQANTDAVFETSRVMRVEWLNYLIEHH